MLKIVKLLPICAAFALTATVSHAEEYDNQIKARQAYMNVLSYNVGILGAMSRGRMDYDSDLASAAAMNIKLAAQMNNGSMWPQGSDIDSHKGSYAKASMWQNFDEAGKILTDFAENSEKLAMEAGKGLDEMKKSFGPVGQACSSCHKKFRVKK